MRTQGKQRAAVLGAHTLAVDIWSLLTRHTPYADRGWTPWTGGTKTGCGHAVKRLETLGYEVTLTPAA